ncbi:hypothetical protein MPH_01513 [Macrophomina phaseolina MS6]|uniref:DUF7580 domain-containing protein n=1 Tax=Macrophomina phaseolina (strain MS6) TaxID=1126212 RepID=K2S8C4_MACPH|nr:hypothetical protein MPH_01513 [Macrophomina phaseolina MS6]
MSGFEIAGVVLGAWPLLDQSLSFYKKRSEEIFYHEHVMNEMIRKLHLEHARFRNSCEKLIAGLAEDSELDVLLENPTEQAWKSALQGGLENGLKSRLGRDFFAYNSTIRQIGVDLLTLRDIVGIDDQSKRSSWRSTTRYKEHRKWHAKTWKKIKDCLNHDKHRKLLSNIDENNTYLERLTPGVRDAEAESAAPAKKIDISRWESCHSQTAHSARLRLEERVTAKPGQPRFSVSFSFSYRGSGDVNWQETEVEAGDEDEDEDEAESTLVPAKPRVAFAQAPAPQAPIKVPQKCITNLCTELTSCRQSPAGACLGYVLEKKRKHYIQLTRSAAQAPTATISLYELLRSGGRTSSPTALRLRLVDRYRLACILASSLLQLHTTSWLGPSWTSQDIHFVPTADDMRLGDCAFVCSSFTSAAIANNGTFHSRRAAARQWAVRNEAIFGLGVVLLELSISAPLRSEQTDEDRALGELADCNTAHRIANSIEDDNVQEWNKVVRKCLTCDFGEESDFENKKFRQTFYNGVVAPLYQLYEMM